MARPPTIIRFQIALTDVDRGVYETLELRVAQHPSETTRYMIVRVLAYALSYEDGITFSKGGISSPEEPPIAVYDPTGMLTAWIEVGAPSAERLHKVGKAAPRAALFTVQSPEQIAREAATRVIHRAEHFDVWHIEPRLVDDIEPHVGRDVRMELVRTDGQLYVTMAGQSLEGRLERGTLVSASA